jgi:hypothetical protein
MILELYPKTKKITIELPDELVGKRVEVIIKEKEKSVLNELGGV